MARIQTVAGYTVRQYTSPNRTADAMSDHRGVVLHIAEGGFEGTISWQMNPDQRYGDGTKVNTCSTWIVGKLPGQVAQMVDSDEIAWCQRAGSRTWLSIELAGFSTQPDVPTDWQRKACAELFLWSHRRYGHALEVAATDAERGLGHHSMDREVFGVEWGHEQCPGRFVIAAKPDILARAKALADPPPVEEPDMTPEEHQWLGDTRWALTQIPTGEGRQALHQVLPSMLAKLDALAAAAGEDAKRDVDLAGKVAGLQASMDAVRDAVESYSEGDATADAALQKLASIINAQYQAG